MLIQGAMKRRRFTFVNKLHKDGLDGETQSCKAKDLTRGTKSNWRNVILHCDM
jgi:hypothetical protein